jgi:DNA-binding XRE family transcriptional regulator
VTRGIKQEWLAHQIGVPANTISRISNGKVKLTLKTAQKIARALNTTVDELSPLPKEDK